MKQLLSARLFALAVAIGAAALLVAAVQAGTSSPGAVIALRKTALGTILVDARGRTLYLFEKDRRGVSTCNTACVTYWPALTSHGTPRAGLGVHQSLLGTTRRKDGRLEVTYNGHPLYTFVGDKRAGQTSGEGLNNFGDEWYAVGANGQKVEQPESTGRGSGSSGGYGGYSSSGGW
jgi:predicted lipoprotein with Yx(FWY)xxD motif